VGAHEGQTAPEENEEPRDGADGERPGWSKRQPQHDTADGYEWHVIRVRPQAPDGPPSADVEAHEGCEPAHEQPGAQKAKEEGRLEAAMIQVETRQAKLLQCCLGTMARVFKYATRHQHVVPGSTQPPKEVRGGEDQDDHSWKEEREARL
jgi:hypothetical protein